MKDRKLWKLLATLRKNEVLHFQKWLSIELGNRQQYVQRLATILIDRMPLNISNIDVWHQLYPGVAYNDSRLRKLCRDLLAQLEEFLAIEAFRKHPREKDLMLLEELNRRSNQELFSKLYRKIEQQLHAQPIRNSKYYLHLYKLRYLLSKHYLIFHHGSKRIPIEALNQAFDAWWIHEKLELACTTATNAAVFGESMHSLQLEQAMEIVQDHPEAQEMHMLYLHYELYQLLSGRKEDLVDARAVRNQLFSLEDQLDYTQKKEIFGLLLNYYIRQLNASGNSMIAMEIFELYQWAVKEKLIYTAGSLTWQQYKNLITICLRVNAYEQAWNYIHKLKADLPEDDQEEAYIFNLGSYYLAKEQFKDVICTLSSYKFSHPFYEIPARANLLQAHYELPEVEIDWLQGQLGSLIRYVREQKLATNYKTAYLNRFKLFRRLVKAYTKREFERLLKDIQQTKPINKADWLLEKAQKQLYDIKFQK